LRQWALSSDASPPDSALSEAADVASWLAALVASPSTRIFWVAWGLSDFKPDEFHSIVFTVPVWTAALYETIFPVALDLPVEHPTRERAIRTIDRSIRRRTIRTLINMGYSKWQIFLDNTGEGWT
jgi:hypothetical protein